ncbi:MAG TPA: DUF6519 domain-containing protein, partial [Coleofasciculaceae cyanobacterium]
MKGDFTRSTFRPEKHYTSVRMQQGRLQLDADWNEQVDIQEHLRQAQAYDMFGDYGTSKVGGVSKQGDSFKISLLPNGEDFVIAPGHMYVQGIFCELDQGSTFSVKDQAPAKAATAALLPEVPQLPDTALSVRSTSPNTVEISTLFVDGRSFQPDEWVEFLEPGSKPKLIQIDKVDFKKRELVFKQDTGSFKQLRRVVTYKTQPDYPNPDPTADGVYLVYLDVWQQHITAVEDPDIREIALSIPDTTTRTKTVWQVKLLKIEPPDSKQAAHFGESFYMPEWEGWIEQQQQAFLSETYDRTAYMTACAKLCPAGSPAGSTAGSPAGSTATSQTGFQGSENQNQLYRVEIHQAGKVGEATFKWSRDNGSLVSPISTIDFNRNWIVIRSLTSDLWRTSQTGQWLELTNDELELKGQPGVLVQLQGIIQGIADTKLEVSGTLPTGMTKVRRWDQQAQSALPATTEWTPLENGIKVKFEQDSQYKTGDYWLIPARAASGDIEWLRDDTRSLPQPPQGIEHFYAPLALLQSVNKGFPPQDVDGYPQDYRRVFPSLDSCVDRSGDTMTGALEIQADLYVTGRYQTQEQRYVAGKLGIATRQPRAQLHIQASPALLSSGTLTLEDTLLKITGEDFEKLYPGATLQITESSFPDKQPRTVTWAGELSSIEGVVTQLFRVEPPFSTLPPNALFTYQQPVDFVRLEASADQPPHLVVNHLGNVGIGTTPATQLDVAGKAHVSEQLTVDQDTSLATTSGNVAIGSATSNTKLTVTGNAEITATLSVAGDATVSQKLTADQLSVTNDAEVGKTLKVQKDTALAIAGGTVAVGSAGTTATLSVAGNADVSQKLTANQLSVTSNADISQKL